MFENSKWIWKQGEVDADEYAEFYKSFEWNGGKCVCRLACDSDYTLFINGQFVASNQYGDFEWYKVYDEIDVTSYLQKGKNHFAVLVWYFGMDSSRYIKAPAGLIYELEENGNRIAVSDASTLSRESRGYKNRLKKWITGQLGCSFEYDATKENEWTQGQGEDFAPSVCVEKHCTFYARPIRKHILDALVPGKQIQLTDKKYYTFDLGKEVVGLVSLKIKTNQVQKIRVAWGEDLQNGKVRRKIGSRDFTFDYTAKSGENEYTNYMLRIAARYIEVDCEAECELVEIGMIPQVYGAKKKPFALQSQLDTDIYNLCVNSLQLCMMEHYVDCPWREQCLYAFDSRNQMLCGYYAFENGNAEYARANLLLIGQDRREDGLTAICYPCGQDLTIPSFCMYYIIAVEEYYRHTGDLSLVKEVFDRVTKIIDSFMSNLKDYVICRFEGANHWNFYDWSPYSEGNLWNSDEPIPDMMINALTAWGLDTYETLCKAIGADFHYAGIAEKIRTNIRQRFYNEEKGVFTMLEGTEQYTEVANAFAVKTGIADEKQSKCICEKLANGELVPMSLSLKTFKYDALLKTDEAKYKERVFEEIRQDYKKMLDADSSATWETAEGAIAFDNAGSLCHGWSAIPIYYYHKYGDKKQ